MNASETTTTTRAPGPVRRPRRGGGPGFTFFAQGEPMIWLTGGMLAVCLAMIVGMILLVVVQGGLTFWPSPVVRVTTEDGRAFMGEVTRSERHTPENGDEPRRRRLVRTGNFELTGTHFHWISDGTIVSDSKPEWAMVFERREWGRFYGEPISFLIEGEVAAADPSEVWEDYRRHHPGVVRRWAERRRLETNEIGRINHREERARLAVRTVELRRERGRASDEDVARAVRELDEIRSWAIGEHARISERTAALNAENARYSMRVVTADGTETTLALSDIVRAYPANRLSIASKLRVYLSRWKEFLTDDPREANSEGGVFPAIFGTVVMTLIMTVFVVPFGVLAALYLREYARAGPIVSGVRIAVNNLAGVPSIVFGVFGLGFFCYIVGGSIDSLFYEARLPTPTYGKGGILWASLTLALLTLPVVIVATEEALAAVPGSMREGSYACGASKWQTIRRIVLPRAMPGIMTGAILAMARGAGEVAPLMLVGAVKLAPDLPIDGNWTLPFGPLHPERSFMHLGFHVYDVGFQSPNSEAAKPMVFTTTLLLIAIIALLNLSAIWLRSRLKRRFAGSAF